MGFPHPSCFIRLSLFCLKLSTGFPQWDQSLSCFVWTVRWGYGTHTHTNTHTQCLLAPAGLGWPWFPLIREVHCVGRKVDSAVWTRHYSCMVKLFPVFSYDWRQVRTSCMIPSWKLKVREYLLSTAFLNSANSGQHDTMRKKTATSTCFNGLHMLKQLLFSSPDARPVLCQCIVMMISYTLKGERGLRQSTADGSKVLEL